ncbi:MAG: TusE/DsrC/DsvC family sulfur relay protein [Gemmatimonadetes bacterium]|nr:TusE/DsrC/DsvC family sulfur relay protein [Gemmatimonadota bacterium]
MTTMTLNDTTLDVDAEGYLQKPEQWTPAIGEAIAREMGVTMTDRHWVVCNFMRERYLTTGSAPSIRSLGKESGVPIKELYELFPRGPAKYASRIAGIPKPHGCI